MHKPQQQVRDFHKLIAQPTSPAEPQLRNAHLRARMLVEEAIETAVALVGAGDAQSIVHQ